MIFKREISTLEEVKASFNLKELKKKITYIPRKKIMDGVLLLVEYWK